MDNNTYNLLKALPLDIKIAKTKRRIEEFIYNYGLDNVYISFSGGKDSTVLLHIARSIYPNIKAIFCDNPFEFPEIRKFVKTFENVDIVRSNVSIGKYFNKYGYPVHSKRTSDRIYRIRNTKSDKERMRYLDGVNPDGSKCKFGLAKKHRHYLDAPFKISAKCCDTFKKAPLHKIDKRPIIGVIGEESSQRKINYMRRGCNVFGDKGQSTPLGFWTEQDILAYIYYYNVPICELYGDIVLKDFEFTTTKESRTGCMMCPFGITKDKERFLRLKNTHPKIHDFYVYDIGFKEVLDYMEVEYGLKDNI